jgi:hypothetical protein
MTRLAFYRILTFNRHHVHIGCATRSSAALNRTNPFSLGAINTPIRSLGTATAVSDFYDNSEDFSSLDFATCANQ